jgi:hypothetical protein
MKLRRLETQEQARKENTSMSIQALKESLPELSDEAFERTHHQFALRSLAPVLGTKTRDLAGRKKAGTRSSIVSWPSVNVVMGSSRVLVFVHEIARQLEVIELRIVLGGSRAGNRVRTDDLLITNQLTSPT